MNRSNHNIPANRGRQSSDSQRAKDLEISICRYPRVGAGDWCRLGSFVACACLMMIGAGNVSAQERSKTTPTSAVSKKEQLVNRLQALRAANVEKETVEEPEEPSELFLDLSHGSSAAVPESESTQAGATTLDISISSSPTQILMRAVAWIAIVLCVCCLGLLGARRWQRERGLLPTISSRSRVIETLSLGPSRTVSLIEMHGYRALVATDAGGIRSLVLAPSPFEDTLNNEEEIGHDA